MDSGKLTISSLLDVIPHVIRDTKVESVPYIIFGAAA